MTRRGRILLVIALLAIAMFITLVWLSRPQSIAAIVTNRIGATLGLEITADGASEYRLRGTPMLVLRDVAVREPGAERILLRAKRIHVAVPWSTLRAGGTQLVARRVELDAPRLDLPALQHWLATRPPTAEKRLPALTEGLRIRDGQIINSDWRIDGIQADLPLLDPRQPLRARLRGRYLDAPLSIRVDLAVAIIRPEALIRTGTTGFATHGQVTIERGKDWNLPAALVLSGPLRLGADDLRIAPARLGMAATFETATTRLPFALGLYGPLLFDEATWTLAPAGVALRRRTGERCSHRPDSQPRCTRNHRSGPQAHPAARRRARAMAAGMARIAAAARAIAVAVTLESALRRVARVRGRRRVAGATRRHALRWPLPPATGARMDGAEERNAVAAAVRHADDTRTGNFGSETRRRARRIR
jgi:hypothetical protein